MIKPLASLVLLTGLSLAALAQDLPVYYNSGLVIQGSKAYRVAVSYDEDSDSQVRTIEQYDFPSLVFQNSLTFKDEDSNLSSAQVESNGMIVNLIKYSSDFKDNDDDSITVTDTNLVTSRAYDLNLTLIAEKISEDTSTYTYFPYTFNGSTNCPDLNSVKVAAARTHAKKKKHSGIASCSQVKVLSRKRLT